MKRIFAMLLCALLVCGMAAAVAEEPAATGKLVLYSPLTTSMIENMLAMFEADTGIKTECLAMGTGDALKRIAAESEKPQCDILWSGTIGTVKNSSQYFQDYTCVNEDAFYDEYKNVEGNLTRFDCVPSVIMINTDLIGDIQIKGYKDLLNPELKGKIASADPTASSSAMMHIETILTDFGGLTLENEEGWNVVSELIKNLDGKLASGSSSAWKSVADGEMTVVLTYEEAGIALARSGANIAIVYPEEGTVLTPSTVGLIKNCSHPENGKLFIDFVLSQEVQNILCNELDVRPVRDDVSYPDYFRPASDIKTVDLDQEYVNQHKTEIVDKFTEVYQGTF